MSVDKKNILVLARRNHVEAMRFAAGLTILGHCIRLIFMTEPVSEETAKSEHAELLEISDISPETTVAEMAEDLPFLDSVGLADALGTSDGVFSL